MRDGEESRLDNMGSEPASCRTRLQALQTECCRMEGMVANMLQFKAKVHQLKTENASMKSSFEASLQKYCGHISSLERDNAVLKNQVKKMETQLHGMGSDREKISLLLERLKIVEVENSCLVLGSEQQRQQYETCLDEIANQVVQALLVQKTLREECLKLQNRVQDLEEQNRDLNNMFQQRHTSSCDPIQQNFGRDRFGHPKSNPAPPSSQTNKLDERFQHSHQPHHNLHCQHNLHHQGLHRSSSSHLNSTITNTRRNLFQTRLKTASPAAGCILTKKEEASLNKRRTRSLENKISGQFRFKKRSASCETEVRPESYLPISKMTQSFSDNNMSHFKCSNKILSSHLLGEITHLNKLESQDSFETLLLSVSGSGRSVFSKEAADLIVMEACGKGNKVCSMKELNTNKHFPVLETDSQAVVPLCTESTKSSSDDQSTAFSSSAQGSLPHSLSTSRKSYNTRVLRKPIGYSCHSLKSPNSAAGQCFYDDFSDDDDFKTVSESVIFSSPVSGNEAKDVSTLGGATLNHSTHLGWSSGCMPHDRRHPHLPNARNCANRTENRSKVQEPISSKMKSQASLDPILSPVAKSQHNRSSSHPTTSQRAVPPPYLSKSGARHNQNSSLECTSQKQETAERRGRASVAAMKETKTKKMNISAHDKQKKSENSVNERKYISANSSIPRQRSHSLGHYKGNNSTLSQSSSPSKIRNDGAAWLQSTETSLNSYQHVMSNRDDNDDKEDNFQNKRPAFSKIVRPGQLILAPEDKNFNFPGFSSSSSTSSEDKTPQKIFQSKWKVDMKSSVIEVKKDGTFVQSMRTLGDSSSDTSMSTSSSCSPQDGESNISQTVPKNQTATVKSEEAPQKGSKSEGPVKLYQPGNVDITVGYLLHNEGLHKQSKFENVKDFIRKVIRSTKLNQESSQPKDFKTCHAQIKTFDIDSDSARLERSRQKDDGDDIRVGHLGSKNNGDTVRVERSGSKDDGYSTMSSDIHPNVLDKFCESVNRRLSVPGAEPPYFGVRSLSRESSSILDEATKCLNKSLQNKDKSFDLTSDPDSALETSTHSTTEMVTSTSSQISTSSSDFPLSPRSTKPSSKVARILGRESPKLCFVPGNGQRNPSKTKESSAPLSKVLTRASSPNTVHTGSHQPPESPRRLANEFQTVKQMKHLGSSSKIQNLSLKSSNKSNTKQQLLKSDKTNPSDKNMTRTKLPCKTETQTMNGSSSVGSQICPQQQTNNTNAALDMNPAQTGEAFKHIKRANLGCPSLEAVSNRSVITQKIEKDSKGALFQPQKQTVATTSTKSSSFLTGDKQLIRKSNTNSQSIAKIYAKENPQNYERTLSSAMAKPQDFPENVLVRKASLESSSALNDKSSDASGCKVYNGTTAGTSQGGHLYQSSSNFMSVSEGKTLKYEQNNIKSQGGHNFVKDSLTNIQITDINKDSADLIVSKTSNLGEQTSQSILRSSLSDETSGIMSSCGDRHYFNKSGKLTAKYCSNLEASTDFSQTHPNSTHIDMTNHMHPADNIITNQTHSPHFILTSQTHSPRITMTNQNFQQTSSDSEANEELDFISSSKVACFTSSNNSTAEAFSNINCNIISKFPQSNITRTTNNVTFQNFQKNLTSATSTQIFNDFCKIPQFTFSSPLLLMSSSNGAHQVQSSKSNRQHPYQPQSHPRSTHTAPFPLLPTRNNGSLMTLKVQCLHKSKSEPNISMKLTSSFHFNENQITFVNNDRVFKRFASMSDVSSILCQKSWLFHDSRYPGQLKSAFINEVNSQLHESAGNYRTVAQWICSTSSPPSLSSKDPEKKGNQHHCHHHHLEMRHQNLQQDMMSGTEDECGFSGLVSEGTSSNHEMLDMENSLYDLAESREFNRHFYSLCEFDLNKKGQMSRNQDFMKTCLNEKLKIKDFHKNLDDTTNSEKVENNFFEDQDITVEEIEEITQKIARLSKTVKELSRSLGSLNSGESESLSCLNSGELESLSCLQLHSSPINSEMSSLKTDIDEYHWLCEETITTPNSLECIFRMAHSDTLDDLSIYGSLSDINVTQNALLDAHVPPSNEFENQAADGSHVGEDDIFAETHYDTVKEKPRVKNVRRHLAHVAGDNGEGVHHLSRESGEKSFPVPQFPVPQPDVNVQNLDTALEGEMCGILEQGSTGNKKEEHEQVDKVASSNNESDDSLASDIGLDHMMCQRLIGGKENFHSNHKSKKSVTVKVNSCKNFVGRREDSSPVNGQQVLEKDAFNGLGTAGQSSTDGSVKSNEEDKRDGTPCLSLQKSPSSGSRFKETRDVGVDVMSRSQQQMDGNLETMSLALPETCNIEAVSFGLDCPHSSISSMIVNQNLEGDGSGEGDSVNSDSKQENTDCSRRELRQHNTSSYGFHGSHLANMPKLIREMKTNIVHDVTSYSDFVADLDPSMTRSDKPPPELPPRQPIANLTNRRVKTTSRQPPPPPPPPTSCPDNEQLRHPLTTPTPKRNTAQKQRAPHHTPYVNQVINSSRIQSFKISNTRTLSSLSTSAKPESASEVEPPPPLPPRRPHMKLPVSTRPQEIRPPRIPQSDAKCEGRYASLKHHLGRDPPLPSLSSHPSSPSPATYPRPRKHSKTPSSIHPSSSSSEKPKTDSSRIPRHRLKTRRERSRSRHNSERSSLERVARPSLESESLSSKQWRDIDVLSGCPLSDSSCEDNNSS